MTPNLDPDDLAAALTRSADGNPGRAAATWLLIQHDYWLRRPQLRNYLTIERYDGELYARIDYRNLAQHVDDGTIRASSTEALIVQICASITVGHPADLSRLHSLGRANRQLVITALARMLDVKNVTEDAR